MESNIVSYILENIFFFLPLGLAGILVTLYLYFTSKKEKIEEYDDLDVDYMSISKIKLNVYVLIYLFIFIMMLITGLLSDFTIPTSVGGAIATIPLILMIFVRYINKNSKVP